MAKHNATVGLLTMKWSVEREKKKDGLGLRSPVII